MTRYAALLRGVNVGGVTIRMAELAEVFRDLELADVKTVLASGNVVFDSADHAATLKPVIEAALRARFGYEAWVHVLPTRAIEDIVAGFPFDAEKEGWHPYVIFLLDASHGTELLALQPQLDPARESLAAGNGVLYWTVERGSTVSSIVGKASSKAKYKSTTTTRNLRTLQKLLR